MFLVDLFDGDEDNFELLSVVEVLLFDEEFDIKTNWSGKGALQSEQKAMLYIFFYKTIVKLK